LAASLWKGARWLKREQREASERASELRGGRERGRKGATEREIKLMRRSVRVKLRLRSRDVSSELSSTKLTAFM
jgi:hypothetical protein